MKPFIGNNCGHGYCMSTECEKCCFYKPTCFSIRVPRWLGNMLFRFEWLLLRSKKTKF